MPASDNQTLLHHLRRGITDLWFLLSVVVSVLLLLVLLGYHPGDPGWSASGYDEVRHWLGTAGAYVADALLSLFGYTAYLIPIGLLLMGWHSARRAHLDAELTLWKMFSMVVSLVALSGIFSLHWPVQINSLALTGGGMLGQKLSIELLNVWPLPVVMAIYSAFFLLGMTILLEIRWLTVFEWIGRRVFFIGAAVMALFHRGERITAPDQTDLADGHDVNPERTEPMFQDEPDLPLSWQAYKADSVGADHEEGRDEAPLSAAEAELDAPNWLTDDSEETLEGSEPSFHLDDSLPALEEDEETDRVTDLDQDAGSAWSLPEAHGEGDDPFLDFAVAAEQEDAQPDGVPETAVADLPVHEDDSADSAVGQRDLKVKMPLEARTLAQPIDVGDVDDHYTLPSPDLLALATQGRQEYSAEEIATMKRNVEEALRNYRIEVNVVHVAVGPVVIRLELDLAPGIKVSQVSNLDKDIARSLAVSRVRVVDVIPGKRYIGLEIPNRKREIVRLRSILESAAYQQQQSPLTLILGADIAAQPVVANLGKMPHLLVAGTTGSGKSVGINVMLTSMLYKAHPDELKLILVDPKMLEMSMYADIPHLLTPVVTDMNDAENALRWAVAEMERRYQLMAAMKVRSIDGFNSLIKEKRDAGERIDDPLWQVEDHLGIAHQPPQLAPLPYIVIVIDELADMMMAVGKKVEELIARIAQKARAAGIHLILATQRPSVDVITGLIKANVPTRIAFQVSSKIDSRTIIDQQGAEALLGYGDMLFVPPGSAAPQRVHGAYIEDQEVDRVTTYIKSQGKPNYEAAIIAPVAAEDMGAFGANEKSDDPEQDPLYDEAVAMVIEHGKASISWLQRRLSIGYNRSARLIEAMEQAGIVSAPDRGVRKVLIAKPDNDDDPY